MFGEFAISLADQIDDSLMCIDFLPGRPFLGSNKDKSSQWFRHPFKSLKSRLLSTLPARWIAFSTSTSNLRSDVVPPAHEAATLPCGPRESKMSRSATTVPSSASRDTARIRQYPFPPPSPPRSARMTSSPEGGTTSSAGTWVAVKPYLRQCAPPHSPPRCSRWCTPIAKTGRVHRSIPALLPVGSHAR